MSKISSEELKSSLTMVNGKTIPFKVNCLNELLKREQDKLHMTVSREAELRAEVKTLKAIGRIKPERSVLVTQEDLDNAKRDGFTEVIYLYEGFISYIEEFSHIGLTNPNMSRYLVLKQINSRIKYPDSTQLDEARNLIKELKIELEE